MSNYRPTRPQHRAKAHDQAHTEEAAHDPATDAPHPLIYRGDAKLIGTQEALGELLTRLRAAGSFAYDSEFIGELTYLPKLCLIQVATTQEITLIDPIAKIDLTPFWELVADPSVEKITHAGQQDVEPVIRHLNRRGTCLIRRSRRGSWGWRTRCRCRSWCGKSWGRGWGRG
jgi:ribonuclease D